MLLSRDTHNGVLRFVVGTMVSVQHATEERDVMTVGGQGATVPHGRNAAFCDLWQTRDVLRGTSAVEHEVF